MFVGRGVAVGLGAGIGVEVVRVAATFASTVASIAVSASRVPLTPASTVAGTSAVGRDAACSSAVDGASPEQATAVSPEITRTIRMRILIFLPQCRDNFQSSLFHRPYRQVQRSPELTEANSPAEAWPGRPTFPVHIQSLPFRLRRRVRTRGLPAQYQRLRAMPLRWTLACVAQIPEANANAILCSHCCSKSATPNSVGSG